LEVDIIELMSKGESQTLEFLPDKVPPLALAKVISAFANAEGGIILLGVMNSRNISGVDSKPARTLIEKAQEMLSSPNIVTFDIKKVRIVLNVAVIKIKKSVEVTFCDAGAYVRIGETIKPMPQSDICLAMTSSSTSLESLSGILEKQTLIIESLEKTINNLRTEVAEGNSFKSKIKDHSISAVIGGIVGIAIGAIGF
jgi:predicted HTH transcriptional regulator